MSVFVCGDTHGHHDIAKLTVTNFQEQRVMTGDNYLIIAGDAGLFWNMDNSDRYWLKWMNEKPWKTLIVPGNHENYDILNSFPVEHRTFGNASSVGVTPYKNIFIVKHGSVLELCNKTIFCFGGAMSIDKERRQVGISWWKDEIPNYRDIENGIDNLNTYNNTVDYVITHAVYMDAYLALGYDKKTFKYHDPLHKILQEFYDMIDYQWWYSGHYHEDTDLENLKTSIVYNRKPIILSGT